MVFRARPLGSVVLAYLTALLPLAGQQPAAPGGDAAVFHARTRLVLVDVVVTDNKGQTVSGLKASDFTLLEDGRPETVRGFDPHVGPAVKATASPARTLPPHEYTNIAQADPGQAVNIVLFDMLNTPMSDQMYARQQLTKLVSELPPGQRMALFAMGSRLHMIQGFTGSSDTLLKSVNAIGTHTSPMFQSEEDIQTAEITAQNIAAETPTPEVTGQLLQDALQHEEQFQKDIRTRMTLDCLNGLARAVSGYSGRKNLIWLSAAFPFHTGPELGDDFVTTDMPNEAALVRETTSLLATSQIAVYPIDVRGLTVTGLSISSPNPSAANAQQELTRVMTRQTDELANTHLVMSEIAQETGGQAFYNTNDIRTAMTRSIERGSSYYTLAYAPENHDWNGNYRKIQVKGSTSGLKLEYRRGYYATQEKPSSQDEAKQVLTAAMLPTVPESTMLHLFVRVLPPDPEHKTVRLDYAVDPKDVVFDETPEHREHAALDFGAVAWTKDHATAGYASSTMNTALKPETYQRVLQSGLPLHAELNLRPGTYVLRVGVVDRGSQRVGTLDVPLTVPGDPSAPK